MQVHHLEQIWTRENHFNSSCSIPEGKNQDLKNSHDIIHNIAVWYVTCRWVQMFLRYLWIRLLWQFSFRSWSLASSGYHTRCQSEFFTTLTFRMPSAVRQLPFVPQWLCTYICALCCVFCWLAASWKAGISVFVLLAGKTLLCLAEQKDNDNIFLQQ